MGGISAFFARIVLPGWLSTTFKVIGGGISAAFNFVVKNPWQAAVIVLALFSAVEWHEWGRVKADDLKARHGLQICQDGRKADQAAYVKAQADALAKVKAERKRLVDSFHALNTRTQTDASHDHDTARAAVARYIAANRVSARPRPASGAVGATVAAGANPDPVVLAGSGGMPLVDGGSGVVVSEHDITVCTDNTVNLHAARELVVGLHDATAPPGD